MRGILPALVGIGLCASAASADTVNLQFVGTGSGRNVRMSHYYGGSWHVQNVFSGQLRHAFTSPVGPVASQLSGTLVTFCSDVLEYVRTTASTYTLTPIANVPNPSGMGATRAQGVYDLYAAAGGGQLATGANSSMAAAFQILLWEIVYDFNGTRASLNTSGGILRVNSTSGGALDSATVTWFNTWADAVVSINSSQNGLIGLTRAGAQDQIVSGVQLIPLPAPVLLGAAGLGLLAVVRRRLAR